MILLAVNYHYVRPSRLPAPRAIYPITVSELDERLAVLSRAFEWVSGERLVGAVRGTCDLPERGCVITFDDGLREQFEVARPVLARHGVPALFFVPGRPLAEHRALDVHKVHAVREAVEPAVLASLLERELTRLGIGDEVDGAAARAMYRYDEPDAARVKYLLNVVLSARVREEVVARLFVEIVGDEDAFCTRTYMDRSQVAELGRTGGLGAHGFRHEPMALLEPSELLDDLGRSAAVLQEVAGTRPAVVSYPYGSAEAVSPGVGTAAAATGFLAGFTMERALNRSVADPLLLARVDVNDAPGGSHEALTVDGTGELVVGKRLERARRRYLQEAAAEDATEVG